MELSLILPVYNDRDNLKTNFEKVYETMKHDFYGQFEIILAEDGSDDGSEKMVKKLSKLKWVRMTSTAKRRGRGGALKDGSMAAGSVKFDTEKVWLFLAISMTIVSMIYWTAYVFNAYSTFHEYYDAGVAAYSAYYHIHYPQLIGGLEYIIFWNHVEPTQLLTLPIFALFPSTLTLLIIQELVLSLTGLIIFFVARDLLKSGLWGVIFSLAFLVNPGMHGMIIYDYHAEFLFFPFFILAFYGYMKANKTLFYSSFILLLAAIDTAPFIAGTLALALLLYGVLYTKDKTLKNQRITMAVSAIVLSFIALYLYNSINVLLDNSYATNYLVLPPEFHVNGFDSSQTVTFTKILSGVAIPSFNYVPIYTFYSIFAAIFCFGFLILFDPIISLVLTAPWLYEALFTTNTGFYSVWYNDFAYVIGGITVAAMIGAMLMEEHRGLLGNILYRVESSRPGFMRSMAVTIVLLFSIFLFMLSPILALNKNVNSLNESFLFQTNSTDRLMYSQLDWVIKQIPANASLLTEYFIVPHVSDREYLMTMSRTTPWFTPQYVLVDNTINNMRVPSSFNDYNISVSYAENSSYLVYAQNGSAILYKHR